MDNTFFCKKNRISYLLSILVLWIHYWPFDIETDSKKWESVYDFLEILIRNDIARFAVPLFFVISGFVFFGDFTIYRYPQKISNRVKSLLIPYLLWNSIITLWTIVYPFLNPGTSVPRYDISFTNILRSVIFHSENYQFWFLYDLIIVVILSPIIYVFIKRRWIGVGFLCVILGTLFFCQTIPLVGVCVSSLFFFSFGGVVSLHFKDFILNKKHNIAIWSVIFVFVTIVLFVRLKLFPNISVPDPVHEIVLLAGAVSLWNSLDVIIRMRDFQFWGHSFWVFALHPTIAGIVRAVLLLVWTRNEWSVIPFFIVSTIIILSVIEVICRFVKILFPRLYCILAGGR